MKQNAEWIKFVGPEGQVGILKSSVAETVINFWGNNGDLKLVFLQFQKQLIK